MEFTFKDEKIKKIFDEIDKNNKIENNHNSKQNNVSSEIVDDKIKNNIDEKKEDVEDLIELKNPDERNNIDLQDLILIKSTVERIESKQNIILEILKNTSSTNINNSEISRIKKDELELLNYQLILFNNRLIIVLPKLEDEKIKELLVLLSQISDYILSNSFYIFTIEKSPIKKVLNILDKFGMDKRINESILNTEKILRKIDKISSMDVFEQNYYYSELLLEKGLILQSVILLNEAIGIYIIESIKGFSKDIEKKIYINDEENITKLYSQAKDFFISLFPFKENQEKNAISIFPNHKFTKDIDKEITHKFNNIYKTRKRKKDEHIFEKYSYIIYRVRQIRNNLAHGNMEIKFSNLKEEIKEIHKDFRYISIEKNLFKYKIRR